MKKQIGNDVRLEWTILRKGVAEDFTNATDLSLTAFIPNLSVDEVAIPIARVGNVFTLNIPTTELAIGTYTIRLQYKKPDPAFESGKASISTAVNSAFQIVPIGASEDDLNDEITSNVVYCTDGATYFPSISVVGSEVILSWINDKGYVNPLPINIKGDKGDIGKSVYEYYLESTTESTPMTEAEFSTMLGALPTYVQNAILATNNANNAATNANNAANAATESAEDADSATILANNAADNANTKAVYAQTQGDYAKVQGDYAKAQGDYAHEQGLMAYTAANEANATNDSVQASENLRVSAESDRVNAEANRVTQENSRISAESDRVSAENSRVSAESSRVTAENGRVSAESDRVNAEANRVTQENSRISAESDRVSAENSRVTAESSRVTAENGRVTAESGRVTAENDRVAAEVYRNKYIPVAFDKRVTTDSGTIRNKHLLNAIYDDALNLLPNTDLWYNFECGIKTRDSGLNRYVEKVYDLSPNNRDATQVSQAYQPYLVGNINPSNRFAIWGGKGDGKYLDFPHPLIKSGSDNWSLSIIANNLTHYGSIILPTTGGTIRLTTSSIYFENKFGGAKSFGHNVQNAISRYYLVAKNGILQFYLNGKFVGYSEINTAIDIANLYTLDVNIYDFRIFNKALDKSEIEFLDAKMSAFYPQFEGVEIGNQYWEASNAMDTIAPDGTIIPEVTDNAAWAALTTPAWCYYNNLETTGAIYGRMYNGYAVQKITGSPIWRAPMSADFSQLSAVLGGDAVAGGKLKAEGLIYWNAPNTGASNESGFAFVGSGVRLNSGDFGSFANDGYVSILEGNNTGWFYVNKNSTNILLSANYNKNFGFPLRRLRRVPPGALVREITSGVFTANITGGIFRDIAVPNMYRITGVKVTSAQALINFTLEARTSAGVLVQNLLSGKSIGAGKSIIFSVVADMEVMLQDYIVRATAVGNGGAGMEIELIIEKIKV